MSFLFSPEIILLNITQTCRSKLFDDILHDDPILYAALYSNKDSEIYKVYRQRYDLYWLKFHWEQTDKYIKTNKLTATQKGQLLSLFAKWYCRYSEMSSLALTTNNDNVRLMQDIINLKIGTLESIIEYDKRCNDNIKRIETSFMKSIKLMNDKIETLKKERTI